MPGSDAEDHVARRFPHKKTKRVGSGLRVRTIATFLARPVVDAFSPAKSKGLDAVYHFTFTGQEQQQATVTIRDGKLAVEDRASGRMRSARDCR